VTKITKVVFVAACLLSTVLAAVAQDDLDGWLAGRTLEKTSALRPATPPAADTPAGLDLTERAESVARRTHEIHTLLGPQHVSKLARKRLSALGLGPARRFGSSVDKAIIPVDTLRVLIVRIDFETDRSGDLTSVTTDGGFLLEPDPDMMFDAPPHDRDYYMAHLAGLSEYYKVQSGGKLRIEGRVLPEGDNDAYSLSDIADYGPGAGAGWTLPMLETLVQDMITAADVGTQADGDVSLADFDDDDPLTYVVFVHAGADWQSDVNMDSPNDIPTFFVTLGEPVALTSIDSSTGMPGSLTECSIIPETTSQDGLTGGIAGALYHEFGHALGLPDVYDTSTGLPAVGYWDLMDSGPNLIASIGIDDDGDNVADRVENVLGILPPSLSAWCRWYLGWLRVDELTGDEREIHLPAVQVERDDYNTWYRDFDFNPGYPQASCLMRAASLSCATRTPACCCTWAATPRLPANATGATPACTTSSCPPAACWHGTWTRTASIAASWTIPSTTTARACACSKPTASRTWACTRPT
jgi:M6 family metalloprotease-like protein